MLLKTALARMTWLAVVLLAASPARAQEQAMAQEFFNSGGKLEDFCLALLNRNEFVYIP